MDEVVKGQLLAQAQELMGLENQKSPQQLKTWITETSGVEVVSLNKKEIGKVREDTDGCAEVGELLDIRASLSKTSTGKYAAMIRTACHDSRIRGITQFYGAGRWAVRLVGTPSD
ncbi:MAG: hypothetical protein LBJ12_05160 [Oscillospiraceae bacterium]|jgi:DNA polymerase|nr:hypothetical protein [Oscillospiraceae bacterium]